MIKYIFFDLDGTLTASAPGIIESIKYGLAQADIYETDEDVLQSFIGPPLVPAFMEAYGISYEQADFCLQKYREFFEVSGIFNNSAYPGIVEVAAELQRRGYKLAIATSKPLIYAEQIAEHFEFAEYFDYIAGPGLDGSLPTKADVINDALAHFGITEEEKNTVLMIGDRKQDMYGAKQCNIPALGVLYGYGSEAELLESGADYIAAEVKDIIPTIENIDK